MKMIPYSFSIHLLLLILLLSLAGCHPPGTEETADPVTDTPSTPVVAKTAGGEAIDLLATMPLSDWDHVLADSEAKKEDVWSITGEGILRCSGTPLGFLATRETYRNFKIEFSWHWPEYPKNSGFFLRIQNDKPIPQCIEIQLQHGSAGAIMGLGGMKVEGEGVETFEHDTIGTIHRLKRKQGRENRPKEWNSMMVRVEDGSIRVTLNGVEANACTGADITPGPIGFQSEGGVIEFKDIRFTPLD